VIDYLKLFTFLSLEEIAIIEKSQNEAPERRLAQEVLAKEVVTFVHGEKSTDSAKKVTDVLFGKEDIKNLSEDELVLVKESAPKSVVKEGTDLITILLETGLASSKREARTFILAKAISIDDEIIEDVGFALVGKDSLQIIKRGKKQRVLVEVQ
jgi:tyrosyl-tRNA synthetase